MTLDVVLLPRDLDPARLPTRSVVAFDVLRATTTMTAALAAGVREIRVFPDTAAARQAFAGVGLGPRPLLCGEENCLPPAGFDLGNSPGVFGGEHAERTLFMSTTNGTRAIIAAQTARLLLVGALVNRSAVARVLFDAGHDVILLCAGTNGQVAMEDVLGAGAVIDAFSRLGPVQLESDVARMAARVFHASRGDLPETLAQTTGGRNVVNAGLPDDVTFAAQVDRFAAVGRVAANPLRVLRM
jgi:2-phosphosulfolactate phosphatase